MIRSTAGLLLLCLTARAQTPIENTGAPLLVPYTCTAEDIDEAGLTCTNEQPCPVYLELNSAETVLSRIFLAGDLHTSDATLYSILLASDDGGKTWTEPQPRTRFTSFEQIQFFDYESGWISGANVQGVPRDPFFLLTADGGKTWTRKAIFDESRTGVVERFWFDSKTSGELLITTKLRHELYETKTGGDSWSMRQFSPTPLRLKKDRAPGSAVVRVRADAKTHSYIVEKSQGEAWIQLAAFLIDAGKCKDL